MVDIKRNLQIRADKSVSQYLKEIGEIGLLDKDSERELARRAREDNDDDARGKLVRANLRFVVSMASKYQNLGLPLSDLINEGNLGLLEAARRFDERKGVKFISYAVWWIRQAILYALSETSRPIRIPLNRINDLLKIEKYKVEFSRNNQREPTTREISSWIGMPVAQIESLLAVSDRQTSLNNVLGDDNASELLDFIEDPEEDRPLTDHSRNELRNVLDEELEGLSDRESEILKLYFGLAKGGKNYTLEEIGRRYGLTRERIRQIKEKGIQRLRHSSRSYRLRPFLN
jgi:RNA polymerase primary sigma factor